jgi:hypothetical protein
MQLLQELRTLDPKVAAKRLRTALQEKKLDITHGECLDLVARQLGLKDWNVMSARLEGSTGATDAIEVPPGWLLDGTNVDSFVGRLDAKETYRGHPVFWLRNANGEQGHATLMQTLSGKQYSGKRVCFSGFLRSANVVGSATIWLRADDDKGRFTKFNNLEKVQPGGVLKGTTDWSSRAIVLDVPESTDTLNFGFYLYGTGEAWFCGFELQVVGNDVPVTRPLGAKAPANLDFTARTGVGD